MRINIVILLSSLLAVNVCFSQNKLVDPMHTTQHGKEITSDCMVCHKCDGGQLPTENNLCLQKCTRPSEIKLTNDIVIIDRLVEQYEPVIFAHNLHANMSAMSGGCENCHHYYEIEDEIQSCGTSGCHSEVNEVHLRMSKPSLKGAYHRQCMGCHREWSHDTECAFCHAELTDGKSQVAEMDRSDIVGALHPLIEAEPVYIFNTTYEPGNVVTFHHTDHTDQFGLKCTDCHQGDGCFHCHDTEPHSRPNIKHVETCCKCHREEDNCSFCHANNPKPPFEHFASTGWELNEHHMNSDCSDCHGSAKSFTKPSTTCTSCHIHWDVGVFDHVVTGLSLSEGHEELDCEECHIGRDFSTDPTCDNCHDEVSYPDELPGEM